MLIKDKNYKEEEHSNWDCLVNVVKQRHINNFDVKGIQTEWIFRGLKDNTYNLTTSLERAIGLNIGIDLIELRKNYSEAKDYKDGLFEYLQKALQGQSIHDIESGLIRKFRRQYHQYDVRIPEEQHVIEWLALMQHYGAPTRLLDWTYSFYVALFFALSESKPAQKIVIWALEKYALKENRDKLIPKDIWKFLKSDQDVMKCKTWFKVFKGSEPAPFVYPVNPFRLNERLIIQQGDFLCPGDISQPFEENLAKVLPNNKYILFKYVIHFDFEQRKNALLQLHEMNINNATLYPGLAGFAKSLSSLLISPKNLIKADKDCKIKPNKQ